VLGFFLKALLIGFSIGSFDLPAEAPFPVAAEAAMAPLASCSKPCPPYAGKVSQKRREEGAETELT
jgi:hypothetical protein